MKQPIFFPFYHIHSPLVKVSLGMNDNRSIERFFRKAGIEVHDISGKKCVTCEDLLSVTKPKPAIFKYEPQSDEAKEFLKMFK